MRDQFMRHFQLDLLRGEAEVDLVDELLDVFVSLKRFKIKGFDGATTFPRLAFLRITEVNM